MEVKLSIVVPFHWMENWQFFLIRCLQSIEKQSFEDYEIILVKQGRMAETTNAAIKGAKGELVKILLMDDYLAEPDSLKILVDNFKDTDKWMVTGCWHDAGNGIQNAHLPRYTEDIHTGNNCIGSPSVLLFRREGCLFFDEKLSWLPDCDLYRRLHDQFGPPKILNSLNVVIGLGPHQNTYVLPDDLKQMEHQYMSEKYL